MVLIQIEEWEIQIGPATGAVVVYTRKNLDGEKINLAANGRDFTARVEKRDKGVYAAVFPAVPPGSCQAYWLAGWKPLRDKRDFFTVYAGEIAERDWR